VPLYAEHSGRLRIAAYVDYEFPVAKDAAIYRQLDQLAKTLDADYRVVHTVVGDPSDADAELRGRYQDGLFVPQDSQIHANDVEHLRATLPQRFDKLIDTLAGAAVSSRAAVIHRPEIQTACSGTRWLRGWSPDLIVSFGLGEFALHSMIASQLLDVPRLTVLDQTVGDTAFALLLPLHVAQCDGIVARNEATAQNLRGTFGTAIDTKLLANQRLPESLTDLPIGLQTRLAATRAPEQPRMGPLAAFRTRDCKRSEMASEHGFLVFGTERTGSNLLVSMLDKHASLTTANEVFNPRMMRTNLLTWLKDSPTDIEELKRIRLARPNELHARLLDEGRHGGAERTGFKLLYYHAVINERLSDHVLSQTGMPIVHLLRRDRLPRFVSFWRATESDEWFAAGNTKPPPNAPLEVPARALFTDIVLTELFEDRYRALLREHTCLELDYDDLCHDLDGCRAKLSELFSLQLDALVPSTTKTGNRDLNKTIANLEQVQSWLHGTGWSNLLPGEPSR
jgi:LPS sulfotransferase NodH